MLSCVVPYKVSVSNKLQVLLVVGVHCLITISMCRFAMITILGLMLQINVFPMSRTQCTFKKPVAKGEAFCDRAAEEGRLADAFQAWQQGRRDGPA